MILMSDTRLKIDILIFPAPIVWRQTKFPPDHGAWKYVDNASPRLQSKW